MPSNLVSGFLHKRFRVSQLFHLMADGVLLVDGTLRLTPKENPETCTVGDLNISEANELNVCTAADTWTVVGTQS